MSPDSPKKKGWPDPQRDLAVGPTTVPHAQTVEHLSLDLAQKRISLQYPSGFSTTLPRASCNPGPTVDLPILFHSRNQVVYNTCNGFTHITWART